MKEDEERAAKLKAARDKLRERLAPTNKIREAANRLRAEIAEWGGRRFPWENFEASIQIKILDALATLHDDLQEGHTAQMISLIGVAAAPGGLLDKIAKSASEEASSPDEDADV